MTVPSEQDPPAIRDRLIRRQVFGQGDWGLACVLCGGLDYSSPGEVAHKPGCKIDEVLALYDSKAISDGQGRL